MCTSTEDYHTGVYMLYVYMSQVSTLLFLWCVFLDDSRALRLAEYALFHPCHKGA